MYPKSFFSQNDHNPTNGTCFVLMPFDRSFDEVYATISETLKGTSLNFSCKRADEIFGGGHIIEDILRSIGEAEIIIADLTGRNANVFYELGITHMIKDVEKVLILTQDISDIPFDLKQYRCLEYEQGQDGLQKLKDDLENTIKLITQLPHRFSVGMGEEYVFPVMLPAEDQAAYYFTLSGMNIGEGNVKFRYKLFRYSRGQTTKKAENYFQLLKRDAFPINPTQWLLLLEDVSIPTQQAHFKVILKNSESVHRIIPDRDETSQSNSENGLIVAPRPEPR